MKRNFKDKKNKTYKKKKNDIRICTYNILAPMAVPKDSKHYASCNKKCMKWENRFKMIKDEILNIDPEIICLVEVQTDLAYIQILPEFNSKGYHGFYIPQKNYWFDKEKGKIIHDPRLEENNFGVAILFKTKRFDPLNFSTIDYHKIAKKFLISSKLTKFQNKIMKKFAGIQIQLKDKITKKEFIVCCVHLEHNPRYADIKNLQAYLLLKVLSKISNNNEVPVLLCGDFNSHPNTAVYEGITMGISTNIFDDEDFEYPRPFIKTPNVFTYSPYKSSFKEIYKKEPKFTNFTVDFKNTLDYIFVNKKVKVNSALEKIKTSYSKKYNSFPNNENPSDHIMLASDIQL